MTPVSVIVPLAKGEQAWRGLLSELELPKGSEVLLAAGAQDIADDLDGFSWPVRIVTEGNGRAGQMNAGARSAKHTWLWFLHADSRLSSDAMDALRSCVDANKECLYFFDLRFLDDGPSAVSWNEWAVKWRSGRLKLPFGDQAFLIRKDTFEELGCYREDLPYGEDHVLVWKAHQMQVPVQSTNVAVYTSARRYKDHGWLATTSKFVWLTLKQAFPQWLILQRLRLKRLVS